VLRTTAQMDGAFVQQVCERLAEDLDGTIKRWTARVRFVGQGHELDIAVTPADDGNAIAKGFRDAHGARYGFTLPSAVEVVAMRAIVETSGAQAKFVREADESSLEGPIAFALPDATMWIAAGWRAEPLEIGGWRLTRGAQR
jgi:N-methylhydantoinase A/oxoprolinase/acetone carboxylase beta subunit